jgi:hypothetical protein
VHDSANLTSHLFQLIQVGVGEKVAEEDNSRRRSVHDNRLLSYCVDSEERRIVLRTRYEDQKTFERTDIVFDGVIAYHFGNDNFETVLFDVKEVSIEGLLQDNREDLVNGQKFCWPGPWNDSEESCLRHFKSNGGKAFEISSSFGMGDGSLLSHA